MALLLDSITPRTLQKTAPVPGPHLWRGDGRRGVTFPPLRRRLRLAVLGADLDAPPTHLGARRFLLPCATPRQQAKTDPRCWPRLSAAAVILCVPACVGAHAILHAGTATHARDPGSGAKLTLASGTMSTLTERRQGSAPCAPARPGTAPRRAAQRRAAARRARRRGAHGRAAAAGSARRAHTCAGRSAPAAAWTPGVAVTVLFGDGPSWAKRQGLQAADKPAPSRQATCSYL